MATHGHGGHEHGAHIPHESPPSMWIPLVVLAVLATIGGFVGISPAFTGGKHVGGKLNIVTWLNPIIWSPATREFGMEPEGGSETAETHAEPNARVDLGQTPHE